MGSETIGESKVAGKEKCAYWRAVSVGSQRGRSGEGLMEKGHGPRQATRHRR